MPVGNIVERILARRDMYGERQCKKIMKAILEATPKDVILR